MAYEEMNRESEDYHDDEDQRNPTKRRRVSQACEWCRKKKIKCDGIKPTCTNCKNTNTECEYTQIPRKPRAPKKKTANIGELENRLERIESLLESLAPSARNNSSGINSTRNQERRYEYPRDHDSSVPSYSNNDYPHSGLNNENDAERWGGEDDESDDNEKSQPDSPERSQDEGPLMPSHIIKFRPKPNQLPRDADIFAVTMSRGTDHYCTNGTIFSILSKAGMKWIVTRTSDKLMPEKLRNVFSDIHCEHFKRLRPFVVEQGPPEPPSREVLDFAWQLVNSDKNTWDSVYNLAELKTIMDAVYDDTQPRNGYAEYLVLFSLCALSMPLAPMIEESDGSNVIKKGEVAELKTTKDAMELQYKFTVAGIYYFHRMSLLPPTVTGLRGLIFLILSLQYSNLHPVISLTPVACRFAYELGLHRRETTRDLEKQDANRLRRLFWMVYSADRDTAMKVGRGPSIMDFDISTVYPDRAPIYDKFGFDMDIKFAELMKIYGDVYVSLYSARATEGTPAELAKNVARLDQELTNWRDSLPAQFRPGGDFSTENPGKLKGLPTQAWYIYCAVTHLHFSYFQLLANIHRLTAFHPSWINSVVNADNASSNSSPKSQQGDSNIQSPLSNVSGGSRMNGKYGRLYASLDICVNSARSTVELIRTIGKFDNTFLCGSLFYCINSFITLFIKCIERPREMSTNYDLDLMSHQLEVFRTIESLSFCRLSESSDSDPEEIQNVMCYFWRLFYDIAREYVEKSQSGRSSQINTPQTNNDGFGNRPSPGNNNLPRSPHSLDQGSYMNNTGAPAKPLPQDQLMQQPLQQIPQQQPVDNFYFSNPQSADRTMNQSTLQRSNSLEDPFNGMDPSFAQSLYQVSSYFYSWDPDLAMYPEFPTNGQI